MSFNELGLAKPIVRAIATKGYKAPTPIQAKALPLVIDGQDVLGCAQTGTGKTGAFAMPILNRLAATTPKPSSKGQRRRGPRRGSGRRPRVLVLCPTRELATQIEDSFKTYGRHLPLDYTTIFGGVSQHWQVRALKSGVDVIVATPGRLMDLMNQGHVNLESLEVLVLDEADRMLDMGFINDIRKIVKRLPRKRQTLLFSATMPKEIRRLSESILNQPAFVQVDPVASTRASVKQSVYMVRKNKKPALLNRLIQQGTMGRTLIFTRTKHGADRLVKTLRKADIHSAAIHGNKTQNARTRALDAFKSGRVPILIATDIASRGIDVDEITHVFNYDLPNVAETYVHRIGRTARAGASGTAVSFCDHDEMKSLRDIEKLIDKKLISENEPEESRRESDPDAEKKSRKKSNHSYAKKRVNGRGKSRKATAGPRGQRRSTGKGRSNGRKTAGPKSGRSRRRSSTRS
ncbi:MAG: DEAD/DEAH box helicase [Planctomycetota bacterium]|nr:DEAD/DEAH box helicase [Planctomycetota bacterium]